MVRNLLNFNGIATPLYYFLHSLNVSGVGLATLEAIIYTGLRTSGLVEDGMHFNCARVLIKSSFELGYFIAIRL